MSEIYDGEILRILQETTTLAVAASITASMPIAYVDRVFDVPDDQKYLELVFIPNNGQSDFLGSEKNYRGMFRLILHWPINDEGAYPPHDVIASIGSYFSKDLFLGGVKITDPPNFMGRIAEKGELLYPVSLRYSCFRP